MVSNDNAEIRDPDAWEARQRRKIYDSGDDSHSRAREDAPNDATFDRLHKSGLQQKRNNLYPVKQGTKEQSQTRQRLDRFRIRPRGSTSPQRPAYSQHTSTPQARRIPENRYSLNTPYSTPTKRPPSSISNSESLRITWMQALGVLM
eukprot:TRINITY_DN1738_c0_g1_i2.p1 TRINITY_DN1738_c0_g1~~TRINITY_DN1738_c0_g1_i2.p1  ORF type:complete len:147 (-),score=8.05 TRINITY_DN1738_c0_g1_i2:146-586(-)